MCAEANFSDAKALIVHVGAIAWQQIGRVGRKTNMAELNDVP